MPPFSESAARTPPDANARLRELPSVDELLGRERIASLVQTAGRAVVTDAVRAVLAGLRATLKNAANESSAGTATTGIPEIEARIVAEVESLLAPSLLRAINATGVILHTNLGRAPLSPAAIARIAATAGGYSNLEYDLESGQRGKRDVHTARLLAEIAGAESAIVVNNNAAAVFLVLNPLAKGDEEHRRGVVVHNDGRFGSGDLGQQARGVNVALAALPAFQIVFEIRVATSGGGDTRDGGRRKRSAAEIGMENHARGIDRAEERRC